MEFIVLRTSLAYGCMALCCEMLNLVVLGQILWFRFRCWFPLMRLPRLHVVPFLGLVVIHRHGALGAAWLM